MRIALAVAALGSSFAVCAADPPLEFALAHAGAEPITFEAPADEPTVIALADLTRGEPRRVRLPEDSALYDYPRMRRSRSAPRPSPWMSVNLALHRATARAERRIDKPGVACRRRSPTAALRIVRSSCAPARAPGCRSTGSC